MTAKVRIEYFTLAAPGQAGGENVNQPETMFTAQELSVTGGPVASSAAPQFGVDSFNNPVLSGMARIIALSGAVNVDWGAGAAASETTAARIEPALPPLEVPVATGQTLSLIEAADGAVSGALSASGVAPVTGSFSAPGQSGLFPAVPGRAGNVSIWGTFTGAAVYLARTFDGGTTMLPITADGVQLYDWSGPASEVFEESEAGVEYALVCTAITTGSINYRISE